jgi:predicted O-methyltransferase YrrM
MSNPEAIATHLANDAQSSSRNLRPAQADERGQAATLTVEEVEGLNRMLQAAVENLTTQSKINDRMVARLLDLEKQVNDLDARVSRALQKSAAEGLPVYLGNSRALCRVLDSFLMYVDTRDTCFTPQVLSNACWRPAQTRVFSQLVKRGMRVMEVGAQTGYFTLLAAAGVGPQGRVLALEPDARKGELLALNVQVNGFGGQVRALTPEPFPPLDELMADSVDVLKLDSQTGTPGGFASINAVLARSPNLTVMADFSPALMQQRGESPEEFLRAIRAAGFQLRVMTSQATLRPVGDAELFGPGSATLLLNRS